MRLKPIYFLDTDEFYSFLIRMLPQYAQKYRKEWEKIPEMQGWLEPCTTDINKAYCRYCKAILSAKLSDLRKHVATGRHVSASRPFSRARQQVIPFKSVDVVTDVQRKEAQLCLYAAMHTSISSIDHLSDLHENTAVKVSLHRTKCSNVIRNVIGPHFFTSLLTDIGDGYYSLLIDESTDVSVNKMLGIVIRYFSSEGMKIVSTFLGLIHVENGTAECIVREIKNLLSSVKLKLTNLQGIGTDNASAMVGVNAGVYTILKREVPNLVLVRCVCHSLQLAVSKATENTLPRNVEFLIKETYNWFAQSSIRQLSYAQVYSIINDGATPLKILKVADTRWLSIEPAVKRILDQWVELKTHFELTRLKENCYTAELLYSMYQDGRNKVFLSFLYPILSLVQKTNKNFESATADPVRLLSDLKLLYLTIANKIVLPTARIDIYHDDIEKHLDPNPSLGFSFESACREFEIIGQEKCNLKSRCTSFLVALAREIKNRLPDNIKILEKMSELSVHKCLKPNKMPVTDIAVQFQKDANTIAQIELQWDNIHHLKWKETRDTEKFWAEVNNYRDSSGENPFRNLVDLALQVLCLPHSNADIERIFSQMNLIKSKLRNRMKLPLLSNILHVRFGLKRVDKCCKDYVLPDEILKQLGTAKVYQNKDEDSNEVQDCEQILCELI